MYFLLYFSFYIIIMRFFLKLRTSDELLRSLCYQVEHGVRLCRRGSESISGTRSGSGNLCVVETGLRDQRIFGGLVVGRATDFYHYKLITRSRLAFRRSLWRLYLEKVIFVVTSHLQDITQMQLQECRQFPYEVFISFKHHN